MSRRELELEKYPALQEEIRGMLHKRLAKKGLTGLGSTHEIYGVIAEENKELVDAMHKNDLVNFRAELMDILIACVVALMSIDSKTIDW